MGVPLLDLKDPVPHSALDLVLPLSVLNGCNMVPVGGHIQINAALRVGAPGSKEKRYPVCLQVAKDMHNLNISLFDDNKKVFPGGNQYYCIVTGHKPKSQRRKSGAGEESDDDSEEEEAEEIQVKQEVRDDADFVEELATEAASRKPRTPTTKIIHKLKIKKEKDAESAETSLETSTTQQRSTRREAKEKKGKSVKEKEEAIRKGRPGRKRKRQPEEDEAPDSEETGLEWQDDDRDNDWGGDSDAAGSRTPQDGSATPIRRNPSRTKRMSKILHMRKEYEMGKSSVKKEPATSTKENLHTKKVESTKKSRKGIVEKEGDQARRMRIKTEPEDDLQVTEVRIPRKQRKTGSQLDTTESGMPKLKVMLSKADKDAAEAVQGTPKRRGRPPKKKIGSTPKTPSESSEKTPPCLTIPPVISVDGKLYLTGNPLTGTPAIPLGDPVSTVPSPDKTPTKKGSSDKLAKTSDDELDANKADQSDSNLEKDDDIKQEKIALEPAETIEPSAADTSAAEVEASVQQVLDEVSGTLTFDDVTGDLDENTEVADDSFIESLLEHNYMKDSEQAKEGQAEEITPETVEAEDKDKAEASIEEDKDGSDAGDKTIEEEAGGKKKVRGRRGPGKKTKESDSKKGKGRKSTKGSGEKKPRGSKKKQDQQTGYFIQVGGQLYFVNQQGENIKQEPGANKRGKVVPDYDDDKYYPFTVAGIEIHKGFRHKTFTAEQKRTLSRALEPEKCRATICPLCKLGFIQKLSVHLKLHHPDKNDERNYLKCSQLWSKLEEIIGRFAETELDFKCPFCDVACSSFEAMRHLDDNHIEQLKDDTKVSEDAVCEMLKTHEKKIWVEEPHMARLRKIVGSHMAICPFCHKAVGRRSLFYHANNYCPGNVLKTDHFTCKECMHISITEEDFQAHHEKFHSKQQYICQFCATVFERKQMFYQHLRLVHKHGKAIPKEPVHCPVEGCKYKTFHAKRLKVHHERRHAKEMAHLCEHCGASFKCKPYLVNHYMKVHPDLKKYICRRCKRGFRVYEAYRRHETCCFDLADPGSQIVFKKTDNTPLRPEDVSDEEIMPKPEPTTTRKRNIKQEPAESILKAVQGDVPTAVLSQGEGAQEYMYILQEEGSESVVQDWATLENVAQLAAQAQAGTSLLPQSVTQTNEALVHTITTQEEGGTPAPIAILPEQEEYVQEMIVEGATEVGSETVGIDSQELLKLCGNQLGEFPPGTEILVYMDGAEPGAEATNIQVVQQ